MNHSDALTQKLHPQIGRRVDQQVAPGQPDCDRTARTMVVGIVTGADVATTPNGWYTDGSAGPQKDESASDVSGDGFWCCQSGSVRVAVSNDTRCSYRKVYRLAWSWQAALGNGLGCGDRLAGLFSDTSPNFRICSANDLFGKPMAAMPSLGAPPQARLTPWVDRYKLQQGSALREFREVPYANSGVGVLLLPPANITPNRIQSQHDTH